MPGDELFDVTERSFDVAGGKEMVAAWIFDQFGFGNACCQFTAPFNRNLLVALIMEHERGNAHRWKDRAYIDLRIQHRKGSDSSRTRRKPFELGKLGNRARVRCQAWSDTSQHCTGAPELHALLDQFRDIQIAP